MFRVLCVLSSAAVCLPPSPAGPFRPRTPAVNKTTIVFAYAGDLWSVPRDGGEAVRLTTGTGIEDGPIFSPDGTKIAFRGEYDGNVDVYVMDANGGVPRRLTFHPGADTPRGWTPDSKSVLFQSNRSSYSRYAGLFTVPAAGGFPTELVLPAAFQGALSP